MAIRRYIPAVSMTVVTVTTTSRVVLEVRVAQIITEPSDSSTSTIG